MQQMTFITASFRSTTRPGYRARRALVNAAPAAGPAKTPRYPVRSAVAVAQLVEPRVVVPVVAGSSPVRHLFSRLCLLDPLGRD
jgi:hypothetical protein